MAGLRGVGAEPIRITNLSAVNRALGRIGGAELKQEVKQAGLQAAEVVHRRASGMIPVRTGALFRSTRHGATGSRAYVKAGGKNVPYANPIHWGWVRKGIKPNPFFSRALGYTRDEIFKNYQKTLDNLITKAAAMANSAKE